MNMQIPDLPLWGRRDATNIEGFTKAIRLSRNRLIQTCMDRVRLVIYHHVNLALRLTIGAAQCIDWADLRS